MNAIDHVNVDVDDLDTCYRFYRDELELDVVRPPEDFKGEHAMFSVGESVLTLVETGRAAGWDAQTLVHPLDKAHVALRADRKRYKMLIARFDGQFPYQGPYDWGDVEGFYVLDPDGNLLELVTEIRRSSQRDEPLLTHADVPS